MNSLEAALRAKLAADATLVGLLGGTAIWNALAPQGSPYPQVQFSLQAGTDDNETPRRSKQFVYLVKGVAQAGGMTQAGAIDDRIDVILNGSSLTVSGWSTFWLHRESDVRYAEQSDDGKSYFHAGGLYRIRMEASP